MHTKTGMLAKHQKRVLKARIIIPMKQIVVASSSAKPPVSNEDAHVTKNIFAAMAAARQPTHEDLRPKS